MAATNFEALRSKRIDSLNVEVQEYRHRPTGALHYHLAADDRNNCFVVAFPTVPMDSTGVAHILEHTVLCGSRKYPVRDPFFMMLRRSLNTFMNAFTTSDATAYPFATQNRKDFDNLLSVYLDAVFFPRLDRYDFLQEGHRLDFEKPGDPDSPLVYRGVVYNEMKGAMSSPLAQLQMELQSLLFPTTTYHYNSGGEPAEIPGLSYEGLKQFHASHYHPSNATFMTYGDFDAAGHQEHFEEWALKHFSKHEIRLNLHDERRFTTPQRVERHYTFDSHEEVDDKTYVAIGWLLGHTGDARQMLYDLLLSNVLLHHSASPLSHALETTELGTAPLDFCGIDDSAREAMFVCGLEGSSPEDAEAVERLVFDVLKQVADKGVPMEEVESVLTQLEIAQREMTGGYFPYGLQLLSRVLGAKVHDGDPLAFLDIDPALEQLRREIHMPGFIQAMAKRLLDNPHRVTLIMSPDPALSARRQAAERARLDALSTSLNAQDKEQIVVDNQVLDERQRNVNDAELLPKVGLADVPPDLKIPVPHEATINTIPVAWYDQGTNGLVHEQVVTELPAMTLDDAELLMPYFSLLTEVGSGGRDYMATQREAARLGSCSAYSSVRASVADENIVRGYLTVSGKALLRDHAALGRFLCETLETVRFDELPRLRDIISQLRGSQEASVTDRGHSLAVLAAASGMGASGYLDNLWDGPVSIRRLRALDESLDDEQALRALSQRLQDIHSTLLTKERRLLVVAPGSAHAEIAEALQSTWTPVRHEGAGFSWTTQPRLLNEAWVTNTQVSFCARAYKAVPSDHPDAPVFSVLGKFLHNGYLHRAIREQGGAYGSGASYDSDSASFRFFSYRDPRLEGTLKDFDHALEWLQSNPHGYRQLEEAILVVIQQIDQPKSPAGEAIQAYFHTLHGRTPEFRRRFRSGVLGVTVADLQRVGREYLQPGKASTAVITNREMAERHRHLGFDIQPL